MDDKPEVDFPGGEPPTELEVSDVVTGEGDEAAPGATVKVHYVGGSSTPASSSTPPGTAASRSTSPLAQLIPGWQQGIPGMRVGGRRRLVVPPELAYGPAGGGHRLSGKTLIFVIDLLGTR